MLGGEFSYEALQKALELLADFEKKANARVIDSGVLKGVNLDDIRKAGERIILQDGCKNFFQNVVQKENLDVNVHVLSYCWCGDLIRSAFASGKFHLELFFLVSSCSIFIVLNVILFVMKLPRSDGLLSVRRAFCLVVSCIMKLLLTLKCSK